MSADVKELTVTYEEDGVETTRELDKVILSQGTWATIIFRYQDLNRQKQEYGPDKFTIRRYQKRDGEYRLQSKFNISNTEQAKKIIEALQKWIN